MTASGTSHLACLFFRSCYHARVLAQLTFYFCCLALWGWFRYTKGPQRRRWLMGVIWLLLAFAGFGLAMEMWMRGGNLPISW